MATRRNASKYLIVPHYKGTDLPFVFCGVNWETSTYGFPCKNVTGMIEVNQVKDINSNLRRYAKGDRIGFIKGRDLSAVKEPSMSSSVDVIEQATFIVSGSE
jgi:hypothetical protein